MKAYICDRCGTAYTTNCKHETGYRIKDEHIDGFAITSDGGGIDKYLDLCDDCISDLMVFIGYNVETIPNKEE